MKEFFEPVLKDKITYRVFIASVFITIVAFAYIVLRFASLPPFLPIFNQFPWGEKRVGQTLTVFIPLFLGFLIFIMNLVISSLIYQKTPLLSRIFSVTSLLVSILVLIFSVIIINLIT